MTPGCTMSYPCNRMNKVPPSEHCSQQQTLCVFFVWGWCPTALAESINPPKQLVLQLVQGLRQDNGLDAALGSNLLINHVEDASP